MEITATAVRTKCTELKKSWAPRDAKMRQWYRLIQMVDELKTEKMESFVGNDPRSMFNLVLHMLDVEMPHRLEAYDLGDLELSGINESVSLFYETAWKDNGKRFRKGGPRQSLRRTLISYMLSTGWYAVFSIVNDNGEATFIDVWSPIQTYPMWDSTMGLSEVAHIYDVSATTAKRMARRNRWKFDRPQTSRVVVYDYWWVDDEVTGFPIVYNAIALGSTGDVLVKFLPTRFRKIPIYIAPIAGLPDTGALSEGAPLSSSTYNAGSKSMGERWKEEIGQAIVATNEHIYRSWNKWWSFSLQLLRDTAQPRIFERSRTGKTIVKPEDVFRRGAIFRGGPDDDVQFLATPPIPLELRSTQLDLEAMMQRGGVSWALHGSVAGQISAYVMSQIAASANQVMRPFHQAIIDLVEDIDNDWLEDIRTREVHPYGWSIPAGLDKDARITADYDIEIPGDLIQRATVARMLDPNFRLSSSYVMKKLFPEIRNQFREKAMVRADDAERQPENALIAAIDFYRKQAAFLEKHGDSENAELYEMAAEAAVARLQPANLQPSPGEALPPGGGEMSAMPAGGNGGSPIAS